MGEFETRTRAHSLDFYTNDETLICQHALRILRKEYPINVRLLGVRMSSLEQKLPENKNQKQLNDFWKVKKDKTMKNESVNKDVASIKNERKRKRKRNWNQMNGKEDIETPEMNTKRRKLDL